MKRIIAGHKVETGRVISGLCAYWYNEGVEVYNNTSDPELRRALNRLWRYILHGGDADKLHEVITSVQTLVAFWTITV